MIRTFALECPGHFISEQSTKLHTRYYLGVAKLKNELGAKNGLQDQTCSGLERRGV